MFKEPVITCAPATIHPYPALDNLSATKDGLTKRFSGTYSDLGSTRISTWETDSNHCGYYQPLVLAT
jgi:hypothetical protein